MLIAAVAELSRSRTGVGLYRAAEAVFWETAKRSEFDGEEQRRAYCRMYFDYYWEHAPGLFLLALARESAADVELDTDGKPRVLGYICSVADTRDHPELYELAPHIPLFDDLYDRYPAHLHINLIAASRGHGLGGKMIAALEARLRGDVPIVQEGSAARSASIPAPGLHLVTGAGARNTSFYRKNGFVDEYPRRLGGTAKAGAGQDNDNAGPLLLFMGKRLRV